MHKLLIPSQRITQLQKRIYTEHEKVTNETKSIFQTQNKKRNQNVRIDFAAKMNIESENDE